MNVDHIMAILERRGRGIDCTENESVALLDFFDNPTDDLFDRVVHLFPLEYDQWCREVEEGYRPDPRQ